MQLRRNLLMQKVGGGGLPAEYQQVEYLQSSGTQCIDTGFVPTINTNILLRKNITSGSSVYTFVFGAGDNSPYQYGLNGTYINYFSRFNVVPSQSDIYAMDNANLIELKNGILYFDNNQMVDLSDATEASGPLLTNLAIFCRTTRNGTYERFMSMKLYEFKMWESGALIRNMIPCYRKSDNIIGLYDLANGVFYTNVGTGTFIIPQ